MGMEVSREITTKLADEFYGAPEYVVDTHQVERTSCGVRVYHWKRLGGILVPQFTVIIAPHVLAAISKDVHESALKILKAPVCGELVDWDGVSLAH